jgi:hypothetical protein
MFRSQGFDHLGFFHFRSWKYPHIYPQRSIVETLINLLTHRA